MARGWKQLAYVSLCLTFMFFIPSVTTIWREVFFNIIIKVSSLSECYAVSIGSHGRCEGSQCLHRQSKDYDAPWSWYYVSVFETLNG